ncbi:MAG TPA: M13 family metallopeptidase N-terminal domain-containing protein, partial [Candidatus Limnocylindria bacterium]|nr:M13 family metallopeptidase N-terminal domain-containing protein [Candidatus Limnocylindria bacterium]
MRSSWLSRVSAWLSVMGAGVCVSTLCQAEEPSLKVPRFSVDNMDRSVDPGTDFYHFACGNWIKNNPVPSDKSRWAGFDELQERNWQQIRGLLESATEDAKGGTKARRQVGDLYASAMDTNRLEALGFKPIENSLRSIEGIQDTRQLIRLVGEFHRADIGGFFGSGVSADAKNSEIYAFELGQGGLSLPDRDYYLGDGFAKIREQYLAHVAKMFQLAGETEANATTHAATVMRLETALAKVSKTRVELRDPNANYNKWSLSDLRNRAGEIDWDVYFDGLGAQSLKSVIVGQTNFFQNLSELVKTEPLADWKTYLRWHAIHSAAPYL